MLMKNYLLPPSIFLLLFLSTTVFAQDATSLYDEGVKLKNDKKTREALEKFKAAIAVNTPNRKKACQSSVMKYLEMKKYSRDTAERTVATSRDTLI